MSKRSNLLVLTSTYPRWKGDCEPGFVHALSRRLTKHFNVTVLCPASPGVPESETMDAVTIRRFRYAPERFQTLVNNGGIVTNLRRSPWKWLLVPFFLLAQLLATRAAIKRFRPDVIHAHWLIPQGLNLAILTRLSTQVPPFLITSHGADVFALKFWPISALKRFAAARATALTVVSRAMLDSLAEQRIPVENIDVIPMGVDLENQFTPDSTIKRSKHELLFVGRLVEKKGLRYLIDAMPTILEAHPEARLTVAGFGPEESKLYRLSDNLGLGKKVHFIGAVSQDRLPALYRRAALFVAPFVEAGSGDQEGLGLVTVEAIGCGCPVAVSDIGAASDVLGDAGLRFRAGDSTDLANKVATFLSASDAERAAVTSDFRNRVIGQFDWNGRCESYSRRIKQMTE